MTNCEHHLEDIITYCCGTLAIIDEPGELVYATHCRDTLNCNHCIFDRKCSSEYTKEWFKSGAYEKYLSEIIDFISKTCGLDENNHIFSCSSFSDCVECQFYNDDCIDDFAEYLESEH